MCDTFSRSDRGRGQYVVRDFSHALVEEPKTDKISHSQADGLETTIGPGCDIGAGTVIGGGTCIGRDTRTGNNVTLTNCDVGERCYFHNGVAIGQDGFGFKHGSDGEVIKHKQEYRVQIGDNVEIGANTCVDRGSWRDTMIGSDSKLDGLVKVGHNAVIGRAVLLCGGAALGGSSSLGNRVILGGKAAVGDHTKVCDDVRIAARSGVMNDIASPGDFAGWPAVPATQWKRQRLHLKRLGCIRKLPGKAATTREPLADD